MELKDYLLSVEEHLLISTKKENLEKRLFEK